MTPVNRHLQLDNTASKYQSDSKMLKNERNEWSENNSVENTIRKFELPENDQLGSEDNSIEMSRIDQG